MLTHLHANIFNKKTKQKQAQPFSTYNICYLLPYLIIANFFKKDCIKVIFVYRMYRKGFFSADQQVVLFKFNVKKTQSCTF